MHHTINRTRRSLRTGVGATLTAPFLARAASAQSSWPARSVRVIVPYPPGGGADTVSRIFFPEGLGDLGPAVRHRQSWRRGRNHAVAAAAKADPDGYPFFAAAAKKDKDKIRALTHYPSKELEEKNFDIIWKDMFPRAMLSCLAKAKPQRDQANYVTFCKDTIYGFERTPQGWRFAWTHPND